MRTGGIVAFALVLGLGAAGCTNGNGLTGNIGDWVDTATGLLPDTKKPLPGERKAVFPEGVPGVAQGVPPELVKGYQSSPETTGTTPLPDQAVPAPPVQHANAKAGGPQSISPAEKSERAKAAESEKPKPKKKVAAKPPAQNAQSPAQPQAPNPGAAPAQAAAAPWPAPQQARPTAQWPSQTPQQSQSTAAWPDPRQTQQPAQ